MWAHVYMVSVYWFLQICTSVWASRTVFLKLWSCTTCIRSTWIGIKVHVLGVTQHSESESWNEGWNLQCLIGSYWFFFKLICRPCCTSTGVPTRIVLMVLSPTQSPICLVASWVLLLSRSSHFSIRILQSNKNKTKQNKKQPHTASQSFRSCLVQWLQTARNWIVNTLPAALGKPEA